jgi:dTDP-4-dehydrorhamnose reductase
MKEKLLITGSSGYLGREIISDPRIKKFEIITLDKNKVSNPDIHIDLNSEKLEDILSKTLDILS